MDGLSKLAHALSQISLWTGRFFSWFTLGVVLVCFSVVVLRYVFNTGWVWMQDLYVWLNAVMFTGVAGYTFLRDGHVRVDIFYRGASRRTKAWADLIGFWLFLVPFVAVVVIWGWPYVEQSWTYNEASRNAGGLPALYLVKSFIIVFAVLVFIHGLALALRSILILNGRDDLVPPTIRYEGH